MLLENVLPLPDSADVWDEEIHTACQLLFQAFNAASEVLRQEDNSDSSIRFRTYAQKIPYFRSVINVLRQYGMEDLEQWCDQVNVAFDEQQAALTKAESDAQDLDTSHVLYAEPIQYIRTGRRGRPNVYLSAEFLRNTFAQNRNISIRKMAKLLGIDRNTLSKAMKAVNVSKDFSQITDEQLDRLVEQFVQHCPDSGFKYAQGFMRSKGHRVQERRLKESLSRVRPLATVMRQAQAIHRREYYVIRPNSLWHIDGHHKLIQYGIVIHGGVDGKSRYIVCMRASTSNSARTVYKLFRRAVKRFGIHTFEKQEEFDVDLFSLAREYLKHGNWLPYISTHNTRIERLWVEVGSQFARRWRAFFMLLEANYGLRRKNPHHLWLITSIFLDAINNDCKQFVEHWNHHSLRSTATNSATPNDLMFTGKLTNGIYREVSDVGGEDEWEDVEPVTLQRYLGVDGHLGRPTTGAGHPPSSLDSDEEPEASLEPSVINESELDEASVDLENSNAVLSNWTLSSHGGLVGSSDSALSDAELQREIQHSPIRTPRVQSPFNNVEDAREFFRVLREAVDNAYIPAGFGFVEGEQGSGEYSPMAAIPVGQKGNKMRNVTLPEAVWRPRFILWVQALSGLEHLPLHN